MSLDHVNAFLPALGSMLLSFPRVNFQLKSLRSAKMGPLPSCGGDCGWVQLAPAAAAAALHEDFPVSTTPPDLLALLAQQGHLRGVEHPKAKLKKAQLAGVDLSGARLPGVDFSEADLSGANLSGAELTAANFSGAQLVGTNFSKAELRKARFKGARLDEALLSHARLSRANLSEVQAQGLQADGADLSDAELLEARLVGGSLAHAQLRQAQLSRAQLSGISLAHAQLEEAVLERAVLEQLSLEGTVLLRANLVGATLRQLSPVQGANLREADLAEARLEQLSLAGMDLSDAILDQVTLVAVAFEGAILQNTDFQGVAGLTEEEREQIKQAGGVVDSLLVGRLFAFVRAHRWAQALLGMLTLSAGIAGYLYFQDPNLRPVDDLLNEARTLRQNGQAEQALEIYTRLLPRTKDRLDQELNVLYEQADTLVELQRPAEAAQVYAQIAERTSNDRDEVINAQLRQAGALVDASKYEEAIALYQKLANDPTQPPKDVARALVALSQAYHKLGFEDKAMALFEETLKRFPNDPDIALEVNLQMAEVYVQRKLFPQAEQMLGQLDALARNDSQKVSLLIARARLYEEQGNREKALEIFESLVRAYPENQNVSPEARMDLAQLMVDKGEYSWASRIYKDILEKTDDQLLRSQAQLAYGVLLRTLGQPEKALEYFRTVRRQASNNADLQGNSRLEEAETLALLKKPDEALALLEEAIRTAEPGIAGTALLRRGTLLAELGKLDEAAATFQQVSSRFDASGELSVVARLELARLEAGRGNLTAAQPLFEALIKDPAAVGMKSSILESLGQAQLEGRQLDAAEQTFGQLSALPDAEAKANGQTGLARVAVARGDRAKAEQLYQTVAAEAEDLALKVAALDALARLYQEAGDVTNAIATFQAVVTAVPPRHDAAFAAWQGMAEIYEARKEPTKAEELYTRILSQAERGEVRANALLSLARLALDQKKPELARSRFQELLDKHGTEAEATFSARLELARLDHTEGKSDKAITALKNLLSATPDPRLQGQALEALTGMLQEAGRTEEALQLSQKLLASVSEDAEARLNAELTLAASLRQKGDLKGALERLEKLKNTPDPNLRFNVLDGLAQTQLALNEPQKAAESYQTMVGLAGNNADLKQNAMLGQAGALKAAGKKAEATALYEQVIQETSDTGLKSWAQESLAQLLAEGGQTDKAKALLASSGGANGLSQANLLRASGDLEGAVKAYDALATSAPEKGDRAWALVSAAQVLSEREKYDDALERFLKVSAQYPEEAEAVLNARLGVASIMRARGRTKESAKGYEEAAKGESYADYRINATLTAADLYLELGEKDKARTLLEALIKRFPDKTEATLGGKLGLAAVQKAQGQLREAAKAYEGLENASSDPGQKAAALIGAARCYAELNDKPKARELYTRIKTRYADQPELVQEATSWLTSNG